MYEELIQRLRANNRKSGWSDIDKMMDEAASALEDLDAQLDVLVKADVRIMLDQMEILHDCAASVSRWRESKLHRLSLRLEEQYNV